ncbi:MAG: DUF5797 family protein [Haloarculaceae archaeon]
MTLSAEARERLADVVALQPTKNGELQSQWEMDSGSEVHRYLESELKDYYYRDDDSLIRATPEAVALVDGEDAGTVSVSVTPFQERVIAAVPDHGDDPASVVATLHALRDAGEDPAVDDVRSALRSLTEKGVVERVQKTVPTYRLAVPRDQVNVETGDESD